MGWAWRPLFRVSHFLATFPERPMSRLWQTTGHFRKGLKNAPITSNSMWLWFNIYHVILQLWSKPVSNVDSDSTVDSATATGIKQSRILCLCICGFGDIFSGGMAGPLEAGVDEGPTVAGGLADADSTGIGGKPARIVCRIWKKTFITLL